MLFSELGEPVDVICGAARDILERNDPDAVSQEAVAELMAAAIRLYAAKVSKDRAYFPIVPPSTLTATDAMICATALLKSVNVEVFELGLWQAWGR